VRGEKLLALLEEPQGLDHDVVDRLEASGLELGADQLLHFVGQRGQIHARQYNGAHRASSWIGCGFGAAAPYGSERDHQAILDAFRPRRTDFEPEGPKLELSLRASSRMEEAHVCTGRDEARDASGGRGG
jgi:hypothetical protein